MTRILVVEDDPIITADLTETLVRNGYEVLAPAETSDAALEAVREHRPDLVLMDIQLRGPVDGVETATRLRKESDVPVVYLTAHSDESTLARAKETAPYGYLVKPFNERDLRATIEVAVHKHGFERHLADRERWFSTTLASLGDAVIATDTEERITFMNPVAETITGYGASAAHGRLLSDVFRIVDESGTPLRSPLRDALRDRFIAVLPPNTALLARDGQRHLVDDAASPIVDGRGTLLGGVIVFRDVTERKRLEQRLEVAERLASLGTMASGLAHELNNPLAVVMGNVSFALEELATLEKSVAHEAGIARHLARCRSALEDAVAGTDRLRKIIETMRWFVSRRSAKQQVLDLPDLLEPAIKLTQNTIHHKARLVRAYGTTPFVDVDESQMVQVFGNLLANAADAIPDGNALEHEIRIVTYTDDGGRAVIEVRDDGAGIRQSDLTRIFEPFFTTKGASSGMGVGLAICHSFVVGAGGDIAVESQVGHGSTFRVSLPPAARERSVPPAASPAPVARRAKILILDDEPAVATVLRRLLSGHDVVCETDGHAVLSRIANGERFDVLLCDMMMPLMSGIDVYDAIRSANPVQASKIVFLTGGALSERTRVFLESATNPVIHKPFSSDKLRDAVAALLAN